MRTLVDASDILAPVDSREWWLELAIRQQDTFWRKVEKRGGAVCWLWKAGLAEDGSGKHTIQAPHGHQPKQKHVRAPRLAWEMAHGLVSPGLVVYHQCENIRCVRPAHLALGTQAENRAHCAVKGATGRGERNNNHKLADDTARLIKLLGGAGVPDMEIARRVNVPYHRVWAIRTGKAWRHVVANVNLYTPNLGALYAERREGHCLACDGRLPPGRRSLCGDPACKGLYNDATDADAKAKSRLRRELAAIAGPSALAEAT